MVKPMNEILEEADRIVQQCRQEMKQQGFDTNQVTAKLDTRYVGIHSELRRMKSILSAKSTLSPQEEQLYYKLSDILCYSDKAAREMRRSMNRRVEKLMKIWTMQLNRFYAAKVIKLKDKLAFPPIFGMNLQNSGLFVDYQLNGDGTLPKTYGLCRKFETILKRSTGEGMMRTIPLQLQVKIKGFIKAQLNAENYPEDFYLFSKNGKPIISFHSSRNGKICLGSIEGEEGRNFREAFKGAVESQRWDKINEMFSEIERLFMTANVGGAFGTFDNIGEQTDATHKKIYKLWCYLNGEIDEDGNPRTPRRNEDYEEEEY